MALKGFRSLGGKIWEHKILFFNYMRFFFFLPLKTKPIPNEA